MGWMTRKALNMATITLNVKHAIPDPAKPTVHQIDIAQSLTGGIPGTSETRITDWEKRLHEDHVFGKLDGQSRYLRGSSVDGKVRPAVVVNTKVDDAVLAEKVGRFLRGEILNDGAETEGFLVETEAAEEFGEGEGLWLQSFVVNNEKGWTAEQVIFSPFLSPSFTLIIWGTTAWNQLLMILLTGLGLREHQRPASPQPSRGRCQGWQVRDGPTCL